MSVYQLLQNAYTGTLPTNRRGAGRNSTIVIEHHHYHHNAGGDHFSQGPQHPNGLVNRADLWGASAPGHHYHGGPMPGYHDGSFNPYPQNNMAGAIQMQAMQAQMMMGGTGFNNSSMMMGIGIGLGMSMGMGMGMPMGLGGDPSLALIDNMMNMLAMQSKMQMMMMLFSPMMNPGMPPMYNNQYTGAMPPHYGNNYGVPGGCHCSMMSPNYPIGSYAPQSYIGATPQNTINPINQDPVSGATTVRVDGWRKGPNDCLIHILQQRGFSNQEIYRRDANGLNLIQRVAAANGLSDPNMIQAGAQLIIPTKGQGTAEYNSFNLEAGERRETSTVHNGFGIKETSSVDRNGDVRSERRLVNEHASPQRRVGLTAESNAGPNGSIRGAINLDRDGAHSTTHIRSEDGRAQLQAQEHNLVDGRQEASTDVVAGRGSASVSDQEITTVARVGGEEVTNTVNYDESRQDGAFERAGAAIAGAFGYGEPEQEARELQGVARTEVSSLPDQGGTTIRSYDNNGNLVDTRHVAGDSDDSWIERRGEDIDRGIEATGQAISDAGTAIRDTTVQAVDAVGRGVRATGRVIANTGVAVRDATTSALDATGRAISGATGAVVSWATGWFN